MTLNGPSRTKAAETCSQVTGLQHAIPATIMRKSLRPNPCVRGMHQNEKQRLGIDMLLSFSFVLLGPQIQKLAQTL